MSEADVIARTPEPRTVKSLTADLRALGVRPGSTLVVHSSLAAIGWVAGGQLAVVLALLQALGPDGTLVMPAHSGDWSDPAGWERPPVPESWWETIRRERPPFDARTTPTRGMGRIAECFRTWPGALRSGHELSSFAALGPNAARITADHEDELGEASPLARLYELDADVLLLGVGHDRNTSLHLAEVRAGVEQDSDRFPELMAGFDGERHGLVGSAESRLMRQRAIVDFVAERFRARRPPAPVPFEVYAPGVYLHGTKANLSVGDLLVPGRESNFEAGRVMNYVYFSATLDAATWGAELAAGEGRGHIYLVEPVGEFEDDPNLTDKKFPGNPTRSFRSREPLRVVGELVDWVGHPAEQLQAMRQRSGSGTIED